MKITEADQLAWAAVSDVLPKIAEEEVELLPYLAKSFHENPPAIGAQPGAFNAAEVTSVAIAVYSLVMEGLKTYFPKLVEAAIDVGKGYIEKQIEKNIASAPPAPARSDSSELTALQHFIIETGRRYELDRSTSEIIANAIVTRIVITGLKY